MDGRHIGSKTLGRENKLAHNVNVKNIQTCFLVIVQLDTQILFNVFIYL